MPTETRTPPYLTGRLTIEQVAEAAGLSVHGIQYLRRKGLAPCGKMVGRRLYFEADEVNEWLSTRANGGVR